MKSNVDKQVRTGFINEVSFHLKSLKRPALLLLIVFVFNSSLGQNVGIGIAFPTQKLDVAGNIKGVTLLATNSIAIGSNFANYKLHIFDGVIGLTNTNDEATWSLGYNSTVNGLSFSTLGTARLTILNNGNMGLTNTAPVYRLDVNGTIHADAGGIFDGNVTVNNGKGVLYNVHGASNLKYYTRTAAFSTGNLAGFGLSSEGVIGFASAGFTNPPKVFVADIVSTGGTVGELYRVQLIIYEVTATQCKARLLNTSPNTVNYSITWNIVCIGE